jgi:hypothetical protein
MINELDWERIKLGMPVIKTAMETKTNIIARFEALIKHLHNPTKSMLEDALIFKCYEELYAKSEPAADFMQLLRDAEVSDYGKLNIPYHKYFIDKDVMDAIIDKYAKKLREQWKRERFINTIYLGCSPTFKINSSDAV